MVTLSVGLAEIVGGSFPIVIVLSNNDISMTELYGVDYVHVYKRAHQYNRERVSYRCKNGID